jgi:chloramphenicol-sensitive protein RarD
MNKGILYGASAYLLWGFFPIYFKALQAAPALQILFHRITWSFVFLLILIIIRKRLSRLKAEITPPRVLAIYTLAALLLSGNWFVYVWGVNAGYVVETSLGYFINPLVSVALGVIVLRERLRPIQWLPIGMAAAGVVYLTVGQNALPWIALTLAFSFGLYGLIKKVAPLGSLSGITLETGILFLPAVAYLVFVEFNGTGAFGHIGPSSNLLLASAGVITSVPLLLFAQAARQIPLWQLGLLQYIAPTCQFLLGVLVYGEPFTPVRIVGFTIIWTALLIFSLESILTHRRQNHQLSQI